MYPPLAIHHVHEAERSEHSPTVHVLVEVEVATCCLQLVQPAVCLPLSLDLLQRDCHYRTQGSPQSANVPTSSRVPVRAALSSAGSLLFRLRSLYLSMRRSRAFNAGPSPAPRAPRTLLHALHSRRELLPRVIGCRESGSSPTEKERTERLKRT